MSDQELIFSSTYMAKVKQILIIAVIVVPEHDLKWLDRRPLC